MPNELPIFQFDTPGCGLDQSCIVTEAELADLESKIAIRNWTIDLLNRCDPRDEDELTGLLEKFVIADRLVGIAEGGDGTFVAPEPTVGIPPLDLNGWRAYVAHLIGAHSDGKA